jgi:actin-related protein
MADLIDDEELPPVLVFDPGTSHTRVGFSNGEPRRFPSIVKRAGERAGWQPVGPAEVLPQGATFSSDGAQALGEGEVDQQVRGGVVLVNALHRGVVTDWNAAEAVWRHAFEAVVGPSALGEHPVLVSEPPLNPVANRKQLLDTLFLGLGVPAVHVSTAGLLAAYGAGKTTATVLDIGHGVTHVLPVFKGYLLPHAVARLDVAGEALTAFLIRLLTERGHYLSERVEHLQLAQRIKENLGYVAADPDLAWAECDEGSYELPDGSEMVLGTERFRCLEPLFRPALLGREVPGVHELVRDCIEGCAIDTRRELYGSIVLSGGSSLAPGLAERLASELQTLESEGNLSAEARVRVRVVAPEGRQELVWRGGAALAELLGPDPTRWVTREEYMGDGVGAVLRKCPAVGGETRTEGA